MFTSHSFGISPTATRAFEGFETWRELSSRAPSRGKPGCWASFPSPAPMCSCKLYRKYFLESHKSRAPRYFALPLVTLGPSVRWLWALSPFLLRPWLPSPSLGSRHPPTLRACARASFFFFLFFFFSFFFYPFFPYFFFFCSIWMYGSERKTRLLQRAQPRCAVPAGLATELQHLGTPLVSLPLNLPGNCKSWRGLNWFKLTNCT